MVCAVFCCCTVAVRCVCECDRARARAHSYFTADCHCIEFIFSSRFVVSFVPLANKSDSFVTHSFFSSPFSLLFCFYYWIVVIFVVFFSLFLFLFIFLFRLVRMKEMHINKANGKSLRYLFILLCLCVIITFIMHWTHSEHWRLPADCHWCDRVRESANGSKRFTFYYSVPLKWFLCAIIKSKRMKIINECVGMNGTQKIYKACKLVQGQRATAQQ